PAVEPLESAFSQTLEAISSPWSLHTTPFGKEPKIHFPKAAQWASSFVLFLLLLAHAIGLCPKHRSQSFLLSTPSTLSILPDFFCSEAEIFQLFRIVIVNRRFRESMYVQPMSRAHVR